MMDNETFLSILELYPTGQEVMVNGNTEKLIAMDKVTMVTDKAIREVGSIVPLLRSLHRMGDVHAGMLMEVNQDKTETGVSYHIIEINESGILFNGLFENRGHQWRWKEKHKPFNRFTPMEVLWLLKNRFDVFGLIKQGRAIEKI